MENIGGIQVDVSAAIGKELAKLAVQTVDEDKLKEIVSRTLYNLSTQKTHWVNGTQRTELERYIMVEYSGVLSGYVKELMGTDEFKARAREQAKELVDDLQKKVKEIIIDKYAEALSGDIAFGSFDSMFRFNVERIISEYVNRG